MIFVEDLNLIMLSRGMLGKHYLDAPWGQFFTILEQTCLKYGVYFQKVNANKTSQTCPNCLTETGKKQLSERTHSCSNCGYTTDRDVAAAQVVLIRGLAAVGHNACDAFLQVNSSASLRRKNPHAFRLGYVNTKPSGMRRCKLMRTEPIFGNKTLKPLIGLSLNWGNTKDLNWPYFLKPSGRSIYPPGSSAKQSSLWVGAKRNCKPLGTSQVIRAFQSAQSHLDRFGRCSSLSA